MKTSSTAFAIVRRILNVIGIGLAVLFLIAAVSVVITAERAAHRLDLSKHLQGAALDGDERAVQTLLKEGADPNFEDQYSCLEAAAKGADDGAKGFDKIEEDLILHRADVNTTFSSGDTALIVAASQGDATMVRFLLLHHADVRAKDRQGLTALAVAESDHQTAVVRLLKRAQGVR